MHTLKTIALLGLISGLAFQAEKANAAVTTLAECTLNVTVTDRSYGNPEVHSLDESGVPRRDISIDAQVNSVVGNNSPSDPFCSATTGGEVSFSTLQLPGDAPNVLKKITASSGSPYGLHPGNKLTVKYTHTSENGTETKHWRISR